jgi:hypothetical protein
MQTTVYREYDVCVWSQTHWRYLEMKLTEVLSVLSHHRFVALMAVTTDGLPDTP